jgi:hypothetical protein
MATKIENGQALGTSYAGVTNNMVKITPELDADTNPNNVGAISIWSENDGGTYTNEKYLYSPETDEDYRLRVGIESYIDWERFNYAAQNTGKFTYSTSTMTITWTATGMTLNGGSSLATNVGCLFQTRAEYELYDSAMTYIAFEGYFTAQPQANQIIDFGMFRAGGANQYIPSDGIYFRLTSDGISGKCNYNTVETTVTPINSFTYTNNQNISFIIGFNNQSTQFWVNNEFLGEIHTPSGQGSPTLSSTLAVALRMANTGIVATAQQFVINGYSVIYGGIPFNRDYLLQCQSALGSYQGISGNTMGQLIAGTVTSGTLVKPTAAVPVNTSLAANLPNSLGGRIYETLTSGIAVNTDGILASFTVPAGTTAVKGKRLIVTGLKLSATVQTALTGGGYISEFYIAFGHTADSLATTESTTAKAPRRVMCPSLTQVVTSGQLANTFLSQQFTVEDFDIPIIVNPGERLALVINKTGTVATAGIIAYTYQFIYTFGE